MARTFKPKLKSGHRSRFEEKLADQLDAKNVSYGYEQLKIKYTIPERQSTYTPDFTLPNGIIIEAKGWPFEAKDRVKHLLVKEQHPHLDIRFVFANSSYKLSGMSTTTWGDWCVQHGFKYADRFIPDEWLCEGSTSHGAKRIRTTTKKSSCPTSGSTKPRSRTKKQAS